jgi:hypothetical protein
VVTARPVDPPPVRLASVGDVVVGALERPQSKNADFSRELGDISMVTSAELASTNVATL